MRIHEKNQCWGSSNQKQRSTTDWGPGGLAQLRNDAHVEVMANHGYSPDDWLDVANMTARVLLGFMPGDLKWSLGIGQSCW